MRWVGKLNLSLLPIVIAVTTVATKAAATDKIVVEYGKGHSAAFALLTAAEKQAQNGDFNGAIASLNRAIQGDPTFWPALYTRAQVYQAQHRYRLAIQDCNELLHKYPYMIEAAVLRASINAKLGNYAASLKELDYLVSIRPRTYALARALAERAWLRAVCPDRSIRDPQQALKDAKLACSLMQWKTRI